MLAWPNPNDPICSLLYFFEFLRLLFVWLCVCLFCFFFQCSWFQSWYRNSFILVSKPAIFFLLVDRHFLGKWYSTRYDLFSLIINMSTNFFFKFFFISFPLTFLLTAWHDPTDVCGIQRQSRNVWAADSSRSRCEL